MTHNAINAARWTDAEDAVLVRAKRSQLATSDIEALLGGRSAQSIDSRVRDLRRRGIDMGKPRRGRPVRDPDAPDREFESFRVRTTAASAALLAAIVKLSNQGAAHV